MSLNFRRDSPVSSPYGYTVKLAPQSQPAADELVDLKLIDNKTRPIAWFVSHCTTFSIREKYVKQLQVRI